MSKLGLSPAWRVSLLKLAALLATATALGLLTGWVWELLALTLAGYLLWHLGNVYRLHRWLRTHRRFEPPKGWGIWSDIFAEIGSRQRESHARKKQLLELTREYRSATAALPDAVVLLDRQYRINWFNPGATALLGLRDRDDVGRPLTHLIRDPATREWLEHGHNRADGVVIDAPGGRDRTLRLRMFAYAEGQQLLVARDITEIQRVESMRKDFVANVSHELRTPLTVISGYIETMSEEVDAQWQPVVERVANQTARMRAIVEDLLTLSRLDASRNLDEEVVVNVESLVKDIAGEARALSEDRHEIKTSIETHAALRGSPKDLRSAFTNLTSNAVRYTPDGGRIELCWYLENGNAVFCVRDDGPGIAAHHIPRLTERFYRVSTDRSRDTGGTGLGLAIVKHVLLLHGAKLEIRSEVGRGSEFRCMFPAERVVSSLSEAS